MTFQSFQVLLAPISCNAYIYKIFSTYLSLYFLEVNQKRELEIFYAEKGQKIYRAEIQIVTLYVITEKLKSYDYAKYIFKPSNCYICCIYDGTTLNSHI